MLIVKLHRGELVEIDGPCKIVFIKHTSTGMLHIGFDAPRSTNIVRQTAKVRNPPASREKKAEVT